MRKIITILLLSYSSLAFSQNYTTYFTGNTNDLVVNPSGGICLSGGAVEHDNAMQWFLERANGGDILILRASGSDGYNNYFYSQLGVTVNSVETIVFNDASAANETYIHQKIANAEAIWLAGGDQWDYVSYWRETAIDSLINDGLQNRNIVIGGHSAGMAVLGSIYFSAEFGTVTSSTALANPYDSDVKIDTLPFFKNDILDNVITDTHYDSPDRRGRHMTFLARALTDWNISARGIACDEYTAICIDTNGIANIFGEYPAYDEDVYFLQVNCENTSILPENCTNGQPLDWNLNGDAVKVYRVKGTIDGINTFDLNDWETGTGGVWENWSVDNGILKTVAGSPIDFTNCIPVSTREVEIQPISIFPNPVTNGYFNIKTTLTIDNILISNISGQIVKTITNPIGQEETIDISSLTSGIYFVHFQTNTSSYFAKLILD